MRIALNFPSLKGGDNELSVSNVVWHTIRGSKGCESLSTRDTRSDYYFITKHCRHDVFPTATVTPDLHAKFAQSVAKKSQMEIIYTPLFFLTWAFNQPGTVKYSWRSALKICSRAGCIEDALPFGCVFNAVI